MIRIFTDGSCDNKTGYGGTAWVRVLTRGQRILRLESRPYRDTTNNRMELLAIIHALEAIPRPARVSVTSDSKICVLGAGGVSQYGVRSTLANQDLWHRYLRAARSHSVEFTHVRGHRGNHFNEICDQLAGSAYQRALSGDPSTLQDKNGGGSGEPPLIRMFS